MVKKRKHIKRVTADDLIDIWNDTHPEYSRCEIREGGYVLICEDKEGNFWKSVKIEILNSNDTMFDLFLYQVEKQVVTYIKWREMKC